MRLVVQDHQLRVTMLKLFEIVMNKVLIVFYFPVFDYVMFFIMLLTITAQFTIDM